MATSGSTNWTMTRDEIITEALELLGVLGAGETPQTADVTSLSTSLNILVKSLQADRIFLRFVDEQTISLVDGTTAYDCDAGTLRVLDGWLRIDGTDTKLDFIDRLSYDSISAKAGEGQPYYIYVDYAPTVPKAYFYPTPEASYTFHYKRERAVEDFDASTDNADFPVKAHDMLVSGLCMRAAQKFQLGIPVAQYWEGQHEKAKNAYRAGDTQRTSRMIVAPSFVV